MPNQKQTVVNNEGIGILSVLIPSIPKRSKSLSNLLQELRYQVAECKDTHPSLGDVELITDKSIGYLQGGLSIGKKRELLVNQVSNKYCCFLDDDDEIAPNYIETLLRLCYEDKDVCCFRNFTKLDNYWCLVDMSLNYSNEQTTTTKIVLRRPWHICPVRSEYAKLYQFDNSNYGEDWNWMEQVLTHCKTEAKVNIVIHQYNHSSKISEADKIMKLA